MTQRDDNDAEAVVTTEGPVGTAAAPEPDTEVSVPEEGAGESLGREERLIEWGVEAGIALKDGTIRWWHHLRFLLFGFYLFFAVVLFWTWIVQAVFVVIRTLLRGVIRTLEWLGGGGPGAARRQYYPEAPVDLWVRMEAVRWWHHLRFIPFALYLVVAAVGFWLWAIATVLHGIRILSSGAAILLAWIAGGGKAETGDTIPEATRALWARRMVFYRDLARPAARPYVSIRNTALRFWRWGWAHKLAAIVATLAFVALPASFIVPRPHYVQILDDDVLQHQGTPSGTVRYLIHAQDLFKPGKMREYENERAVHLGKIDAQGVKNALVPGRYYRVLVVGLRWYYMPTMFPNIISVKEVDINGDPLAEPAHLIAPPEYQPRIP